jgi:phosphate transport system substrate-binding protein
MRSRRGIAVRLIALVGAAIAARSGTAAALDPALPAYSAETEVSGNLVCTGGATMRDLAQRWADGFRGRHPNARIRIESDTTLSAEGFTALLDERVDCVTYVREPFPAELAAFQAKFGHAPLLVNVAGGSYATKGGTHALAIYVNSANPLSRLTLPQLDAVLSKTLRRGSAHQIATWGELGLGGAWAARPVHVYGMLTKRETGNPPGIVNYLQQRVLLGGEFRDDVREQRDQPGESALEGIVNRIAADRDGIGCSGFAFVMPGVKAVALAEARGGPYYRGSPREVALRLYPLSRRIYLMVNRPPDKPLAPLLREFLRWTLSREGQQIVAEDSMHFVPLNAAQARAARASIDTQISAAQFREREDL